MTRYTPRRPGFTLVELMVVMAIIAFLAAMVMLMAPDIMAKDRARDAASQLQGALQNARMRAMRDGMPRGVRLIIDPSSQGAQFTIANSYQYLEVPPWLLFNNQSGQPGVNPYLQLSYTLAAGTITGRTCTIGNLTPLQLAQVQTIVNGSAGASLPPTLGLPTLNLWTTIVQGSCQQATASSCTIQLAIWPDAPMGAASLWITYAGSYISGGSTVGSAANFGIYPTPRPLLGEPVANMPVNTCVDLSSGVSSPSYSTILSSSGAAQLPGYDIVFSPSGQMMMPYGLSQVYLWVRDPTKGIGTPIANPYSASDQSQGSYYSASPLALGGSYTSAQYGLFLPAGGEQLLVSIKGNSGATGVSPVFWGANPYAFAQAAATSQ